MIILLANVNVTLGLAAPSAEPATPPETVKLAGFKITGNTALSTKDLSRVIAPYVGKVVAFEDLERLAELLTLEYRNQGYSIAKAYLPQQEISDGIVEFAILEGVVGDLTVIGNRHYSSQFIKSAFSEVLAEKALRYATLERSLLTLNDYPNLTVSASLQPGKAPGTADIVATAEDTRPVHVTIDYNNFGIPSISRNRFGAGIEIGNVGVEGSLLKLSGIIGDDPDRLAFQLGAYTIPLTHHGTKLVLSGSFGRFDVGGELAALGFNGKIKTYDVSVTHPFVKARHRNLWAEAGFASKDNFLFVAQIPDGAADRADHLRMLKVGINYDRTDNTGRNYLSLYGFQGLGEALGGMANDDPTATRAHADNRFSKATLSIGRVQSLSDQAFLILRGSGQITGGPIATIEQFLLGGPDTVRGYQIGERLGDEGYNVSAEARLPISRYVQLVSFIDHGAVRVRNPQAGEKKSESLTGAGPGLRVNLPYYDTAVRFDVGFPIDPSKALGGSLSGGHSPTAYLQATARF